jgi:hypothetical protein
MPQRVPSVAGDAEGRLGGADQMAVSSAPRASCFSENLLRDGLSRVQHVGRFAGPDSQSSAQPEASGPEKKWRLLIPKGDEQYTGSS